MVSKQFYHLSQYILGQFIVQHIYILLSMFHKTPDGKIIYVAKVNSSLYRLRWHLFILDPKVVFLHGIKHEILHMCF